MQSHYIRRREKNKHLTSIERGKIEALRKQGWKGLIIGKDGGGRNSNPRHVFIHSCHAETRSSIWGKGASSFSRKTYIR